MLSANARLAFVAASLLLAACGRGGREPGLEWRGKPIAVASRVEKPDAAMLQALGLKALAAHPPRRILTMVPGEWGDSLRLFDFGEEGNAYAAFQELAAPSPEFSFSGPDAGESGDIASGVTVCGDRVCFRRGRWVGLIEATGWKGAHEQALTLPGAEPGFGGIPQAFGAMLQRGRVPGSERILNDAFLGLPITRPVYAVRMQCHGDTAWLYAGAKIAPSFAVELSRLAGWQVDDAEKPSRIRLESPDSPPVSLRFKGRGVVGVEGCFDEDLTEYWLKMQIRGLNGLE